jgi:hypothetical protein
VALCSHCSFAHYNEWELDYLIKTTHFSPALKDHPWYHYMFINFNTFGLVLHWFLWSGTPIKFGTNPASYHELTALRHINYGWTLFHLSM